MYNGEYKKASLDGMCELMRAIFHPPKEDELNERHPFIILCNSKGVTCLDIAHQASLARNTIYKKARKWGKKINERDTRNLLRWIEMAQASNSEKHKNRNLSKVFCAIPEDIIEFLQTCNFMKLSKETGIHRKILKRYAIRDIRRTSQYNIDTLTEAIKTHNPTKKAWTKNDIQPVENK